MLSQSVRLGLLAARAPLRAGTRNYVRRIDGHPGSIHIPTPFALPETFAERCLYNLKYSLLFAPPFWFPFFCMKYQLQKQNS